MELVHLTAVAALSGLAGAPHCLIMCGGIASSYAMQADRSPLRTSFAYHAGRITTYSILGGILGAAGTFLNSAGFLLGIQSIASIIGGMFILLWVFHKYTLPLQGLRIRGQAQSAWLAQFRQRFELPAVYLTGLSLGMLPCGLTYAMQMNAAATGDWRLGAFSLFIFGLFTMPILLIAALWTGRIGNKWRLPVRKAGFYVAVCMGSLSIMKGLSANGWVPPVHPWLW